jgi:TetR/AcrR family transcriptional regulator, transcriptional repressor for nem operon
MGRPRQFDEPEVLLAATAVFVENGYEGTSIDDLVKALNLHRGSLYKAFGSKRGLFLAVLGFYVETVLPDQVESESLREEGLDLLLVAALERGHRDPRVATLVRQGVVRLDAAAELLGTRLLERLYVEPVSTHPLTPSEI